MPRTPQGFEFRVFLSNPSQIVATWNDLLLQQPLRVDEFTAQGPLSVLLPNVKPAIVLARGARVWACL